MRDHNEAAVLYRALVTESGSPTAVSVVLCFVLVVVHDELE